MAQSTPGSSVAVNPKREQTVRNDLRSSMKSPKMMVIMTAGHYSQTESQAMLLS
jgi:hypothetical protein